MIGHIELNVLTLSDSRHGLTRYKASESPCPFYTDDIMPSLVRPHTVILRLGCTGQSLFTGDRVKVKALYFPPCILMVAEWVNLLDLMCKRCALDIWVITRKTFK